MLALLAMPLAALLALVLAIWPWTALYDRRPAERLLATLIATSALIVLLQVLLGSFGRLGGGGLLLLTGTVVLGSLALQLAGLGGAPTFAAWLSRAGRPTLFGASLGLLAAAAYAALLLIACLIPPYGWDTLVYHLTDVFHIAQTGGLEPFSYATAQFTFPLVGELHSTWFYLLSGAGADSWRSTGIGLAPLALTAALAVRVSARSVGLSASLPWVVPAVLLTPLFLVQPLAGYVDVAFAAFLLACFAFALLAAEEERPAHLAWAALAGGLALGTKLSFLYFCLPVLLALAGRGAWRAVRSRRPIALIVLCAALFSVGCGFWLVRNLARHGNPLYPIELRLGSITLLEGPATLETDGNDRERFVDSAAGWLLYPFGERFLGKIQYSVDNGFGPLFAAGLVLSPWALFLALRRRSWLLARALAALPLTLLIWFVVSPWEHPRYALAACGFAILPLAALYEEIEAAAPRRLARAALGLAMLFSALTGLLGAAPHLPEVVADWRSGEWRPAGYYVHHYGQAAEAFDWLSDNGGPGVTVSFDRGLFVAPLFGWHGQNRVVWASSPDDRRVGDAPFVGNGDEWGEFLRRERVDWFVLWRPWWPERPSEAPETSVRQRWLRSRAESFRLAADFPRAGSIFKVDVGGSEARVGESRTRPLSELSAADGWVIEYREGAEGGPVGDAAGGVRIDYRFATASNDYLDLRFDLSEGGWPETASLAFDLDTESRPALLFVYLKEADPRRACRFRVDLEPAAGSRQVRLDLASPEWRSGEFDPRRVAEIHLVLDDAEDAAVFEGSVRVSDFRLQLQEAT